MAEWGRVGEVGIDRSSRAKKGKQGWRCWLEERGVRLLGAARGWASVDCSSLQSAYARSAQPVPRSPCHPAMRQSLSYPNLRLQLAHPTTAMSFRQLLPFTRNRPLSTCSPITIAPPPHSANAVPRHVCITPLVLGAAHYQSYGIKKKKASSAISPPSHALPSTSLYGDRSS